MIDILKFLTPIALAAVAFILFLGLLNMVKGGSSNRSQKLMRMRVAAQFVAVIILVAVVVLSRA